MYNLQNVCTPQKSSLLASTCHWKSPPKDVTDQKYRVFPTKNIGGSRPKKKGSPTKKKWLPDQMFLPKLFSKRYILDPKRHPQTVQNYVRPSGRALASDQMAAVIIPRDSRQKRGIIWFGFRYVFVIKRRDRAT
jgi:hypothetical protein